MYMCMCVVCGNSTQHILYNFEYTLSIAMQICILYSYTILIIFAYYFYAFYMYLLSTQNRLTEATSNLYTIQDDNDHQSNGPPATSTSTSDVRTRVLGPSDTDRDVSTTACIIQQYIYNILLYLSHPLLDLRMAALTLTGMYKCI